MTLVGAFSLQRRCGAQPARGVLRGTCSLSRAHCGPSAAPPPQSRRARTVTVGFLELALHGLFPAAATLACLPDSKGKVLTKIRVEAPDSRPRYSCTNFAHTCTSIYTMDMAWIKVTVESRNCSPLVRRHPASGAAVVSPTDLLDDSRANRKRLIGLQFSHGAIVPGDWTVGSDAYKYPPWTPSARISAAAINLQTR
jgi:hypothetical protein